MENAVIADTVLSMVTEVLLEIESKGKSISVSDETLCRMVMDKLDEDSKSFETDKGMMRHYGTLTRDVVWRQANIEEADRIICRLKSGDQLFAQRFFYGTSSQGCNISRLRSKIISQIKQAYNVEVSVEEFGNILYTHLWANGTWGVLDKYSYKSSFFCWLDQIARHEVMRYLEKMRMIHVNRGRTSGNTRLLGMSVDPYLWECVISEMMPEGLYKDLLIATLVERKDKSVIMKEIGIDGPELRKLQIKAENSLKDKLIRSDSHYEDIVLRDKSPREIEVSDEFTQEFIKWQEEKREANPLADVLGVGLQNGELQEKVISFLYEFPKSLGWSDEDRLIWTLRFIENTAPVEVAKRVGKERSWLDTRYSRLNKRFEKAIKEWWKKNYCDEFGTQP